MPLHRTRGFLVLIACVIGVVLLVRLWPERAGQARSAAAAACSVELVGAALPAAVRETSGLAGGRRNPALAWTHNDAGHPAELYALDPSGAIVSRVRVEGAGSIDWEDIEAGPCPAGDCLFIGDIGDNRGVRDHITVYRVAEPEAGVETVRSTDAFHARYPDGPQDAEALFVLPDGAVYLVTKGRQRGVTLYRYPTGTPDRIAVLEPVRPLFPRPSRDGDRVTAATATPNGEFVGVRTYSTLYIYPAGALVKGAAVSPLVIDLRGLGERQGEGLAMSDDGTVWLSSEGEGRGETATLSRLRCPAGYGQATAAS